MAKSPKKFTLGHDKIISGVCSGLAEYFNQDVSIVRLAVVLAAIATGFVPVVLFYLIATWITPEQ